MGSRTALIYEAYRYSEQKPTRKFCRSKEGKNSETHPEKPEKGETGCVPGAGEGCSRYGRVGKPEIRTKMHQIAMQHMKKGNRRKPSVFAGFLAGAEGLVSAAASVGPGRSLPGCRPPRHAPQAGLRAHLVAKSYRTLTKKSGTAEAIPDFFGRGRRTRTLGTRFWSGCGNMQARAGEGRCCPILPASPKTGGAGLVLREDFVGQNRLGSQKFHKIP